MFNYLSITFHTITFHTITFHTITFHTTNVLSDYKLTYITVISYTVQMFACSMQSYNSHHWLHSSLIHK
jgi:hypothetical protein